MKHRDVFIYGVGGMLHTWAVSRRSSLRTQRSHRYSWTRCLIEAIAELGAAFGGRQPQLLWPGSLGGNAAQLAAPYLFDRSQQ